MSNHKPNNYFDSINDFLDNGHRLLVLHEANSQEPNVEEFFLLLNKRSVNSNNNDVFEKLAKESYLQISNFSKATQLYISSRHQEFFFIHLTSMPYEEKNKKQLIEKDQEYISENFKEVLSTAFPFLLEVAKDELVSPQSRSVKISSPEPSVLTDEFSKQFQTAIGDIKKDASELFNFTKQFIEEKSRESQPILNKLTSIKDNIAKQGKILKRMKKS